jgi:formylglycine-generating enzyme required for sulfatase activity
MGIKGRPFGLEPNNQRTMKIDRSTVLKPLRQCLSKWGRLACFFAVCSPIALQVCAQPVVTNVTAVQQQLPSQLVNISYTISDASSTNARITILVSKDSGATWTVPANTFSGAYGSVKVSSTPTVLTAYWNAGVDWGGHYNTNCRVRVQANDSDLNVIPGGTFPMGNSINAFGAESETLHYVTITTAFNMEANLISGGEWNLVVEGFSQNNGYDLPAALQNLTNGPSFVAANHPVQQITWYNAIKWCNARSQFEGATPVYYLDAGFTTLYKTGTVDNIYVNTNANGYRLPTEAQWEYAARGGLAYGGFPWNSNGMASISLSQANYTEVGYYSGTPPTFSPTGVYWYETDPVPPGWDTVTNTSFYFIYNPYAPAAVPGPTYYVNPYTGAYPLGSIYTSPIGSYPTNGFGLYDMAGNVREWCWDWYQQWYYTSTSPCPCTDPQGPSTPDSGAGRVIRGGSWGDDASHVRCSARDNALPASAVPYIGFRCVRGLF